MKIDTKIYSVTIYKDRALVNRGAQIKLDEGEYKIIIENLPLSIDKNTVQVSSSEGLTLYDVKLKKVFLKEIPDEKKKALADERKEIGKQIAEITDKITNTNKEKEFLQNLADKTAKSTKKLSLSFMETDKLSNMFDYYRKRLNFLDTEIRNFKEEYLKLEEILKKVEYQLTNFNQNQLKTRNQVELKVLITKNIEINLGISYVVFGASWKPNYDLRVNTETKKINISYDAVIQQKTGEKWSDVELKLSTAKPHISAIKPELSPWYLNFYEPFDDSIVEGIYDEEKKLKKSKKRASAPMRSVKLDKMLMKEMMPPEKPKAKIESGATSVVFAIQGTNSIIDNNEEHKVCITNFNFDAVFQYVAVPKITPFAYLNIKVKNNSDYPMLAGNANVFLDNNYVTNTRLNLVAPNEEFQNSLGIDEGISVEHKLINRLGKDEGIFSKKNKVTYEYKIIVKNKKKSTEKIQIQDQIPISQHDDIKIELITPKYKDDTDEIKINEFQYIEWNYEIEENKEIIIPLKFSIEYPRDETIEGI